MAHAQKLSDQVKALNARVQELEAALAETSDGKGSHPLLQIRLSIDGEEQVEEEDVPGISGAIGSLSLGIDGQATYHGESSSSEVCILFHRTTSHVYLVVLCTAPAESIASKHGLFGWKSAHWGNVQTTQRSSNTLHPQQLDLPVEITSLMAAFPFGVRECSYTSSIFTAYIPSKERALSLTSLYYTQVAWM